MAYKDYLNKENRNFLNKFEVYDEIIREDLYSLTKACLKSDVTYHYNISKELIYQSPANISRLNQLISAYESDLFLIEALYIEESSPGFELTIITPLPNRGEITEFSSSLTYLSKDQTFISLTNLILRFHKLGIPYLELCPMNIICKSGIFYLKPFRITPNFTYEENYYSPPEVIAGISQLDSLFSADLWALGCIYAELFISLTPLFQAITSYEKLIKMFEVLGVPEWRKVERYMTWETYKGLKVLCNDSIKSFISAQDYPLMFSMLEFDPKLRIGCDGVLENIENSEATEESLPNSLQKTRESRVVKEIDNNLTIIVHTLKCLEFSNNFADDSVLNVSYELDLNSITNVVSDDFRSGKNIQFEFTQRFPINSENFKAKYRHEPIMLNINERIQFNGSKSREYLVGSSEIYIGLLFSCSNTEQNNNSVYGWYNVVNDNNVIGQILVEINSELPFTKGLQNVGKAYETEFLTHIDSIKTVKDELSKLNSFLIGKSVEKESKAKIDDDFADTLKQLRHFLLK